MKKILLNIILLFLIFIPYQTQAEDNKFVIGITTGYSFGLTSDFREHEDYWYIPNGKIYKYKWQNKLGFHFGLNFQYNLSSHWAIQGEIDYQSSTHHEWGQDHNGNYYDNTEDESFTVPYLNLIYNFNGLRRNRFFPYLSAGLGIIDFDFPLLMHYIKIGGGIKYHIFPQIILNLGVFSYSVGATLLRIPPHFNISEIPYFNLNIGLEYEF